jgi:hypothetical protein
VKEKTKLKLASEKEVVWKCLRGDRKGREGKTITTILT